MTVEVLNKAIITLNVKIKVKINLSVDDKMHDLALNLVLYDAVTVEI